MTRRLLLVIPGVLLLDGHAVRAPFLLRDLRHQQDDEHPGDGRAVPAAQSALVSARRRHQGWQGTDLERRMGRRRPVGRHDRHLDQSRRSGHGHRQSGSRSGGHAPAHGERAPDLRWCELGIRRGTVRELTSMPVARMVARARADLDRRGRARVGVPVCRRHARAGALALGRHGRVVRPAAARGRHALASGVGSVREREGLDVRGLRR